MARNGTILVARIGTVYYTAYNVLETTGITATVGIGTNLYLAKVAMDIVAKKSPPDKDGVRIAELNEERYKYLLWGHSPLSDFWQIGAGKMRKLRILKDIS